MGAAAISGVTAIAIESSMFLARTLELEKKASNFSFVCIACTYQENCVR
jgi:hypothetical protein